MRLLAALMLVVCALARPARTEDVTCPIAPDPADLPDAAALEAMNTFVAELGVRPTGSRAHARFIEWIRRQLKDIPGVELSQLEYPIERWTAQRTKLVLRVGGGKAVRLPVAGPIPYAAPTSKRGVTAPLVLVPSDQTIGATNAAGRIVVRPAPAGSLPNGVLLLPFISWGFYDPGNTIDPLGTFYGDFIAYNNRVRDLRDAAAAGAMGLLFVKERPQAQLVDHYEPYEGTQWSVAGAFLGADEGKQITDAIAGGAAEARLVVRARLKSVVTPTLLATIPGGSAERIVIDSHTDGTNAVEDNGPVAMVAMVRYFASLPLTCRPRTLQFTFTTAHFYQRVADPAVRDGGAEQLAHQLDLDYDQGTVSVVLVLEHLGARDYVQVPRANGVGVTLEPSGLRCIQFIAITPSPALVTVVDGVVRGYDMQRTILLQGSDVPGDTVPAHCSFGGQGTPYNQHLLPTIGVIAAPQPLYDPPFGLEAIDFDVMRDQVLGFTELVNRLGTMEQDAIAGEVTAARAERAAGAPGCPEAN